MPWGMGQGARAISESVTPLLFALTAALAGWPECQGLAQSCWLLAQGGWSRDSAPALPFAKAHGPSVFRGLSWPALPWISVFQQGSSSHGDAFLGSSHNPQRPCVPQPRVPA